MRHDGTQTADAPGVWAAILFVLFAVRRHGSSAVDVAAPASMSRRWPSDNVTEPSLNPEAAPVLPSSRRSSGRALMIDGAEPHAVEDEFDQVVCGRRGD